MSIKFMSFILTTSKIKSTICWKKCLLVFIRSGRIRCHYISYCNDTVRAESALQLSVFSILTLLNFVDVSPQLFLCYYNFFFYSFRCIYSFDFVGIIIFGMNQLYVQPEPRNEHCTSAFDNKFASVMIIIIMLIVNEFCMD